MIFLNKGEYTGEVVQSCHLDDIIITNTAYKTSSSNSDWHYHKNLHICFVYDQGKVETKHRSIYSKNSGSIFFYRAGELHRWISPNQKSTSANIEIEDTFLKKYDFIENNIKKAVETNINAKALILKMQRELNYSDCIDDLQLQFLLFELVSYGAHQKYRNTPRWVVLLKELLHELWDETISLQEISKHVGAHPVTVSKNFRKYFHCTLGEYRRKLKIERTIDLVKNTSLSLSEIAHSCGFTDQSHFTRNFKEFTGFLPKDFRKF